MAPPGLLTRERLDELLVRRANGERSADLARRFCLEAFQVWNLVNKHKDRLLAICDGLGVDLPRKGGSLPGRRQRKGFHGGPPADNAPPVKVIPCLKCQEDFVSDGPGDRVCDGCENSEAWRLGGDYVVDTGGRVFAPGAE